MNNKKTTEEKLQMFFDFQEHPESYSEEQIEELLTDDDIKSLIQDAARIKRAMKKRNPKDVDVNAAWAEFAQQNIKPQRNWMKIAASTVGIIVISGAAFAAIHFIRTNRVETPVEKPAVEQRVVKQHAVTDTTSIVKPVAEEKTVDMSPVVFEDAPLSDILSQMAEFYHVKVVYHNEDATKVRLYFNWDKSQSVDDCIKILNSFKRINLIYSDNTITVD